MSDQATNLKALSDGQLLTERWKMEEKISHINLQIAKQKSIKINMEILNQLIDDRTVFECRLNEIELETQSRLIPVN